MAKLNTDLLKVQKVPMKNPLTAEPKSNIGTGKSTKGIVKKILGE